MDPGLNGTLSKVGHYTFRFVNSTLYERQSIVSKCAVQKFIYDPHMGTAPREYKNMDVQNLYTNLSVRCPVECSRGQYPSCST